MEKQKAEPIDSEERSVKFTKFTRSYADFRIELTVANREISVLVMTTSPGQYGTMLHLIGWRQFDTFMSGMSHMAQLAKMELKEAQT